MTVLVAVIMTFSIPIIAIVTDHFQTQLKLKHKMTQDELELEKLKHENYRVETERMRLELEKMQLENSKDRTKIL
jgi:hypothetical protein